MSRLIPGVLNASVLKKQIVALTGLMMVGFILIHLAGNFAVFAGPEALNGYAEKLQALGPLLGLGRMVLVAAAMVHIVFTVIIWIENRSARDTAYAISNDFGNTTFAKKTMIYSGALLFFFISIHLSDFTFGDKHGPASIIPGANNGESLGLFGLVWMSFLKPWRVALYILAVSTVGLHLSHGIQSFLQTLGLNDDDVQPYVVRLSNWIGFLAALGYSSIPIYIIVRHFTVGVGV